MIYRWLALSVLDLLKRVSGALSDTFVGIIKGVDEGWHGLGGS